MRVVLLTLLSMLAFAANSLLCRLALKSGSIDPASFAAIRLASGAAMLVLVMRVRRVSPVAHGSWAAAFWLFAYAATFSLAYVRLPAGVGALLLFGAVQATMVGAGLWRGERLSHRQWLGLALAMGGLVALLLPGLRAPPPGSAALILAAVSAPQWSFSRMGLVLALCSGAITSGLGYIVWYTVLPRLRSSAAATVQLSVPLLAALGGTLLLGEEWTQRLAWTGLAILGGIALVVMAPRRSV